MAEVWAVRKLFLAEEPPQRTERKWRAIPDSAWGWGNYRGMFIYTTLLCASLYYWMSTSITTPWLLAGLMLLGYPQDHLYRIRAAPQIIRINSTLTNLQQASDHSVHPLGTMMLYKQHRSCPKMLQTMWGQILFVHLTLLITDFAWQSQSQTLRKLWWR